MQPCELNFIQDSKRVGNRRRQHDVYLIERQTSDALLPRVHIEYRSFTLSRRRQANPRRNHRLPGRHYRGNASAAGDNVGLLTDSLTRFPPCAPSIALFAMVGKSIDSMSQPPVARITQTAPA